MLSRRHQHIIARLLALVLLLLHGAAEAWHRHVGACAPPAAPTLAATNDAHLTPHTAGALADSDFCALCALAAAHGLAPAAAAAPAPTPAFLLPVACWIPAGTFFPRARWQALSARGPPSA